MPGALVGSMERMEANPTPGPDPVSRVRDTLLHLADAAYLERHPLAAEWAGGRALSRRLLDAIEALRPPAGTPPNAPAWRCHRLMCLRYVEGSSVAIAQRQLALSRSSYHRVHRAALEAVAALLYQTQGDVKRPGPAHGAATVPVPLTRLIGRQPELIEIRDLLIGAAGPRLVTVLGPPGV